MLNVSLVVLNSVTRIISIIIVSIIIVIVILWDVCLDWLTVVDVQIHGLLGLVLAVGSWLWFDFHIQILGGLFAIECMC